MQVTSSTQELIAYRDQLSTKVALVATMGNLHSGHLALVDQAKQFAETVVATIFVNPMQFGANEDLDSYPRTLEADLKALEEHGVDMVFTPDSRTMYPEGIDNHTQISVPNISEHYCGAQRPGHFTGVATIVCKLLNMIRPHHAIFGQKDYQQLVIIKKMVNDLSIHSNIVGVPIIRDKSGLAMSSRNGYMNDSEKYQATKLYQMLVWAKENIESGDRAYQALEATAMKELNNNGFDMEYFSICENKELKAASQSDKSLVILAAGKMGKTRLIDNIEIKIF